MSLGDACMSEMHVKYWERPRVIHNIHNIHSPGIKGSENIHPLPSRRGGKDTAGARSSAPRSKSRHLFPISRRLTV
jgi:hypothetical protein